MRALLPACLIALLASPAVAGVLPLSGEYCGEDILIDADGWHGEEECRFTKVTETGPTWWLLSMSCEAGPAKVRIALSADKNSIAVSDPDDAIPQRLDRCP